MKITYRPEALDASFELSFRAPFFDLPKRGYEVLQALYHGMVPLSVAAADDIHLSTGFGLADHAVEIKFFRGAATIAVTPSRMSGNFRNANLDDVKLIRDSIGACVKALDVFMPSEMFGALVFRENLVLEVVGGSKVRDDFLRDIGSSSATEFVGAGSVNTHRIMKVEFEHPENWICSVEVGRLWSSSSGLFITSIGNFSTKTALDQPSAQRSIAAMDTVQGIRASVLSRIAMQEANDHNGA